MDFADFLLMSLIGVGAAWLTGVGNILIERWLTKVKTKRREGRYRR